MASLVLVYRMSFKTVGATQRNPALRRGKKGVDRVSHPHLGLSIHCAQRHLLSPKNYRVHSSGTENNVAYQNAPRLLLRRKLLTRRPPMDGRDGRDGWSTRHVNLHVVTQA